MTTLERLTIYIDESDRWHGKPVYAALVEEARKMGIAKATVIRGVEGFGMRQNRQIHTANILELASELPMVVTVIDNAEVVATFLPLVKEIVTTGLVIQETVNAVHQPPSQDRYQTR